MSNTGVLCVGDSPKQEGWMNKEESLKQGIQHCNIKLYTILVYCIASGKGCIPEKFGPREKVPVVEGVVKNEHLIPSCGGLHLWHCQAILIGCTHKAWRRWLYNCGPLEIHCWLYWACVQKDGARVVPYNQQRGSGSLMFQLDALAFFRV